MRVAVAFSQCAFTILALALPVAAQDQQSYGESIEVRLNNLDAIVTDRDGKPVPGLTKDDFILLENGVAQEITNFSAYDDRVAAGANKAIGTPADVAPSSAANPAPPRRFVFFIDDMAIQAQARNKLKKHASELVRAMRPGDVAAIVRPTATKKMAQEFTGDPAVIERGLFKAIDECKIRMNAPAFAELENLRRALQRAETVDEVWTAKRDYVTRATERVHQRVGQLRALVASLSGSEGRKIMVIVTSGLSSKPGEEAYTLDEQIGIYERKVRGPREDAATAAQMNQFGQLIEGRPGRMSSLKADVRKFAAQSTWEGMNRGRGGDFKTMIDDLSRTAAAEGVTIYALEPEIPLQLDLNRGAESSTMGSTLLDSAVSAKYTIPPSMLTQKMQHEAETLTSMTDKTGGRWFRGVGSIDDTFRQMNDDLLVYYSLAYRARDEGPKARTLKLAVRNRPELKVRTRSETIDHSKARGMADRVVAQLVYPGDINELQMTITTDKPQREGKMFVVPVEVVIPVEKMTFVRSSQGVYTARVSLHYATAIDQKEFVSYGQQEQVIELSPSQYLQQKQIRYRYSSSLTVPKGDIRIALGVTDTTSSLSSLQTVAVKAP